LTGGQQEEEMEGGGEEGGRGGGKEGRILSAVQLLEHSWEAGDSDVEEEEGREEGKEERLP